MYHLYSTNIIAQGMAEIYVRYLINSTWKLFNGMAKMYDTNSTHFSLQPFKIRENIMRRQTLKFQNNGQKKKKKTQSTINKTIHYLTSPFRTYDAIIK